MSLKSLDTNILLYAINADCPEHAIRTGFVKSATLKENGVTLFHTRNVKDFEKLEYFDLVNPLG